MELVPLLIGIDLGTTNSLCAVFEDGAPRLIPNAHGQMLTPSVVGILEGGEVLVGEPAQELSVTQPARTVATFKRWMGEEREVSVSGRTLTAVELSSLVLRSLKQDAEAHCGREVAGAVITVPAYFNEHQRRATKTAGELAGLTVRRVVNEPTAAALVHGYQDADACKTLMVFDLGGGTFDVTVMEIFEGTLEILSTAGESHLGGEDFTDTLVSWALRRQGMMLEAAEMQQPLLVARLRAECELAKRAFAETDDTTLRFPNADGGVGDDAVVLPVSAALFEEQCEHLLKRLTQPAQRALRDARKSWGQIDDVLMVGGATRMPVVQRLVGGWYERLPRTDFDPDEIVALGAAIQAALIQDDAAVEDLVLTDVCPFTLGVEVSKEIGTGHRGGYFSPVIHRNTTIPVSKEETYVTLENNQRELVFRIFQGESRRTEENLELGDLKVTGIPVGPAGQMVGVRFTYDLNGLLEVDAYIPETGKHFKTVLKHGATGLSEDEIAKAIKRMEQIKFYPRDDLNNQRLLRFAERVIPELPQFQREEFEGLVDAFERAMHSGDREIFQVTYDRLVETLQELGFQFRAEDGEPNE